MLLGLIKVISEYHPFHIWHSITSRSPPYSNDLGELLGCKLAFALDELVYFSSRITRVRLIINTLVLPQFQTSGSIIYFTISWFSSHCLISPSPPCYHNCGAHDVVKYHSRAKHPHPSRRMRCVLPRHMGASTESSGKPFPRQLPLILHVGNINVSSKDINLWPLFTNSINKLLSRQISELAAQYSRCHY